MSLARLIAHNLFVNNWIFKIDDEFDGRGHASFNVESIKTIIELISIQTETKANTLHFHAMEFTLNHECVNFTRIPANIAFTSIAAVNKAEPARTTPCPE